MIIGETIPKTDRATKSSPYCRNRAVLLKPGRKSCPLWLVWWALMKDHIPTIDTQW